MKTVVSMTLCGLLLAGPSLARAGDCGIITHGVTYGHSYGYHQTAVIVPTVAVIQAIPVFSVGVAAPVAPVAPTVPAAAPAPSPDLAVLIAEIKAMRADFRAAQQPPAPPAVPVVPAVPPVGVAAPGPQSQALAAKPSTMQAKCASCHSQAADTKGAGFKLFEGGVLAALSGKRLTITVGKIVTRQMPPQDHGPALTDAEVQLCLTEIEEASRTMVPASK